MARQNIEKRLQILRVSYELFSGVEYEAVSLADIAKRAEISKSLLQYYYPQEDRDCPGSAFGYPEYFFFIYRQSVCP